MREQIVLNERHLEWVDLINNVYARDFELTRKKKKMLLNGVPFVKGNRRLNQATQAEIERSMHKLLCVLFGAGGHE